ncbi:MAG TPA: RHS repeat-associated core domain-containing protein [Flavobacterium sp.]|nr:RHS repeat-associated core domain-containing protein [Flavobacterium sp.]
MVVLMPVVRLGYQYKYNGKELQDELGLNWHDYGARNYDAALGRWMSVDPLAERRNSWSPYTYCLNNPILRYDPKGLTDFTFDKKTGEVKQVGEKNDDPDRILKTNKKGEIIYRKNGEAKVAIGDIEHGILKDGQNFRDKDQLIEVGGKGQPSVDGVKSFIMKLSMYIEKEIAGYSYSSNGSGRVTDMVLGAYKNNSYMASYATPVELLRKYRAEYSASKIVQAFHTHPDGELGATQSAPWLSSDVKDLQRDKPQTPNATYIVLYWRMGDEKPEEYDYTHEYFPQKKLEP